jgi:hypothetical protein
MVDFWQKKAAGQGPAAFYKLKLWTKNRDDSQPSLHFHAGNGCCREFHCFR